jgi:hypothetical protein
LNFTVNEVNGEKPISNWVVVKLVEFVRYKYGLDIKVSIDEKYEVNLRHNKDL